MSQYPIPSDLQERHNQLRVYLKSAQPYREVLPPRCTTEEEFAYIERIAKLEAEKAALSAPVTDEELKVISDAVDTLTKWSKQDFKNSEGWQPMWNPTLRRLRNLLAARAAKQIARKRP